MKIDFKMTKKAIIVVGIIVAIFLLINVQLPYYMYMPGKADSITHMIEVEDRYESQGNYHLVTVSGRQTNIIDIISAQILPHREIEKLRDVRPENMSDDEYWAYQLQMMQTSQNASTVVAYKAANKSVEVNHQGVFVAQIVPDMPAEDILKVGDIIVGIDGKEIKTTEDLTKHVKKLQTGDTIKIKYLREDKEKESEVEISSFKNIEEKQGLGIVLMPNDEVIVSPDINFESGNIGGPSAGLMFALEIYDQLTSEDISRGYQIAGTGEIDFDGRVQRIGGIDKKVVAADNEGMDIFFAPNEEDAKDSNYRVAKKTAEKINSQMKIVPVDHFEDALNYLESLDNA